MSEQKGLLKQHTATARAKPVREPDLPLVSVRQRPPSEATFSGQDSPLDEPSPNRNIAAWDVRVPIFQWEIDPTDTERPCGSAEIKYLGWDFRMWWEKHPAGLIYASIQATRGSRELDWQGGWASPPHSTLALTLVYDEQRQGIISIQGNARNSRPFIDAFLMAFGVGPSF